jgi:hypothetical protein
MGYLIFATEAEAQEVLAAINSSMGLPNEFGKSWDTVETRSFSDGDCYTILKPEDEHLTGSYNERSESEVVKHEQLSPSHQRQQTVDQLQAASKRFAELIADEASKAEFLKGVKEFFFENSSVFINHVINGGNELKQLFETSNAEWLDLRANEQTPTPREYALELLTI